MAAGSGSPTKVNAEAMNAITGDIKHAGDTGQCDGAGPHNVLASICSMPHYNAGVSAGSGSQVDVKLGMP